MQKTGSVRVLTKHAERQMTRCSSTNKSHNVASDYQGNVTHQYCKGADAYRTPCLGLAVNHIQDLPLNCSSRGGTRQKYERSGLLRAYGVKYPCSLTCLRADQRSSRDQMSYVLQDPDGPLALLESFARATPHRQSLLSQHLA